MNFFGKNESLTKSIKNFDSFEKMVWSWIPYSENKSNKEMIEYINSLNYLQSVHYKDRWDIFVFISIEHKLGAFSLALAAS